MKFASRVLVGGCFWLLANIAGAACASGEGAANDDTGSAAATGSGGATSSSGITGSAGEGGLGFTVGSTGTGTGLGCKTTVSGTVYDPAGKLPLYDVVVYVPSEPLMPIAEGAACETCDGYFSGKPIAAALSDAAGKFSLDVTMLSDTKNVPIVVQVGKWRRAVTIPSITACADTPVDASLTRLPKNKGEGNIPQIAMMRGGSDALECLIRKLGVDDTEFTTDSGTGRVHLYYIEGGTATAGTGQLEAGSAALTPASALYADIDKMKKYDLIMMACPGSDNVIDDSPVSDFVNVRAYADQGGRVFGSHYNADYIRAEFTPNNPYPDVVSFAGGAHGFAAGFVATGNIDTSFPKGKAMSDWMVNVGGSMVAGQFPILGGEYTVTSVIDKTAEAWITTTDDKMNTGVVEYFSFPTPVDAPTACGRIVMSDLHVSSGTGDSGKVAFPSGCTSTELSPQEKALAFMFFDLASCIQPETDNPMIPIPK